MMRLRPRRLAIPSLLILVAAFFTWSRPVATASGPFPQQAYVWQRTWTPGVRDAVKVSSTDLSAYVVLAAEVSFRSGKLLVARATVDYGAIRQAGLPAGVCLRIGPYRGTFSEDDAVARRLAELGADVIRDATAGGIRPAELQVDFDCATSKLQGYRAWIRAIRRRVSPVPLRVTALPSWLGRSAFAGLARDAGGYVLQVHSLDRPASADAPMTLCDTDAARAAVERAGRIGVPFRVALPTYGYIVAFNHNGIFEGLSAEGPSLDWTPGTRLKILRADPGAMARLVAGWTASRPACMEGVIWYRLPVPEDTLNWRWPTLASVMKGQTPVASLRAAVRESEPGVFDVELINDGRAEAALDRPVVLTWGGAAVESADALHGFRPLAGERELTFRPVAAAGEVLGPGVRRAVGWVRLRGEKEGRADVSVAIR